MKQRSDHILSEVVKRLKERRLEKGLSHESLAKRAGITRPAVSHIENGKRKPSLSVCLRLAHALEMELADIIKEIESALPPLTK